MSKTDKLKLTAMSLVLTAMISFIAYNIIVYGIPSTY